MRRGRALRELTNPLQFFAFTFLKSASTFLKNSVTLSARLEGAQWKKRKVRGGYDNLSSLSDSIGSRASLYQKAAVYR